MVFKLGPASAAQPNADRLFFDPSFDPLSAPTRKGLNLLAAADASALLLLCPAGVASAQ